MFKAVIYAGLECLGTMLDQEKNESRLFATADEAHRVATEFRNDSSLGIWCKVVSADAEPEDKVLSKPQILEILQQQNKEVFDLLKRRDEGEDVQQELDMQTGETLILLREIMYLEGKIKFDQIAHL